MTDRELIDSLQVIALTVEGVSSLPRSIRLSNEGGDLDLDIFLDVKYGYNIPKVSWDVQKKVKEHLEQEEERKVSKINIHIQGVER